MQGSNDILKLTRIQIILIVFFVILKLLRPRLINSNTPEFLKILLQSLPNFFEAVVGTLVLTGFGLYLHHKLIRSNSIKRPLIYFLAVFFAGFYVVTQEINLHHLGGTNYYDPYDLLFSAIGLLLGYGIVIWMKPKIQKQPE